MTEITDQIESIVNDSNKDDRQKIDALLEMDCNLYANLGSDSTKQERDEAKKISKKIYTTLKRDIKTEKALTLGSYFLATMDL